MANFEAAKVICRNIDSLDTELGAQVLLSLGSTRRETGDVAGAADEFKRALRVRKANHTLKTSEGARLLNSMGQMKLDFQQNPFGALVDFERARRVRVRLDTLRTPDGARLLWGIGSWSGTYDRGLGGACMHQQTLRGSFSAVTKPLFAT